MARPEVALGLKVRRVRTPEGARIYGQPIGSVITPDAFREGQVPALFAPADRDDEEFSDAFEAHGKEVAARLYARLSPAARRALIEDRALDEFFDEVDEYHRRGAGPLGHDAVWTKDRDLGWALNPYWTAEELEAGDHDYEDWLRGDDPRLVDELDHLGREAAESFVWNWSTGWHDTGLDEFRTFAIFEAADQEFAPDRARRTVQREDVGRSMNAGYRERYWAHVDELVPAYRELLRTMHADTQAWFAERGVTEVHVARGLRFSENAVPTWVRHLERNGEGEAPSHGLASWTIDPETAELFASGQSPGPSPERWGDPAAGDVGVVVEATVPVEDVLSVPHTGFGAMDQYEAVVIARRQRVTGRVYREDENPPSGFVEGPALTDYVPDPDAPAEGEFVRDEDGDVLRWRQAHDELLRRAMWSLKGDHVEMSLHAGHAIDREPQPSSGGGKMMRAQAEALLWEFEHNAKPIPKLYRGASSDPSWFRAWSERRAVANHWAKLGGGKVYVLDKGSTTGLRVADYITSQADVEEREWVVFHDRGQHVSDEPSPPAPSPFAGLPDVIAKPPRATTLKERKFSDVRPGDRVYRREDEWHLVVDVEHHDDGTVTFYFANGESWTGSGAIAGGVSRPLTAPIPGRAPDYQNSGWTIRNEEDGSVTVLLKRYGDSPTVEVVDPEERARAFDDAYGWTGIEEYRQAAAKERAKLAPNAGMNVDELYAAVDKDTAFRIRKKKAAVKFYAQRKDGLTKDEAQVRAEEYELEALRAATAVQADVPVPPKVTPPEEPAKPAAAAVATGVHRLKVPDRLRAYLERQDLASSDPALWAKVQGEESDFTLDEAARLREHAHGLSAEAHTKDVDEDFGALQDARAARSFLKAVGALPLPARKVHAEPRPPRDVTFDAHHLPLFEAELERLNKLADKFGVPHVTYTELERGTRKATKTVDELYGEDVTAPPVETVTVRIEGDAPRLPGGWQYVGTIEYLKGAPGEDEGRLVHGNDARLAAFRDAPPDCAYCHLARDRKKTMVLVNEDNELVQVGSSCLKDFLGYHGDPERVTRFADDVEKALKDLEDGGYGRVVRDVETDTFLDVAAAMVREFGWVPKSYGGGVPTAYRVSDRLFPPKRTKGNAEYLDAIEAVKVTADDRAKAQAVRDWVAQQSSDDNYLGNLKVIVGGKRVEASRFGLATSAVGAYDRATGKEIEKQKTAAAGAASTHVGTVGKREVFTATVVSVKVVNSDYGESRLVKLIDDDGNVLKTFASGAWAWGVEAGDRLTFKGTVKSHDEYQGAKETNLTRLGNVENHTRPEPEDDDEEKALARRVRTPEGARHFRLPIGAPIVGGVPDVEAPRLVRAREEHAAYGDQVTLDNALREWLHWEPAKNMRMAAGEIAGAYDDVLSPQLYDDPDESGFLEDVRRYGPPPARDVTDAEEAENLAWQYASAERGARAIMDALANAPARDHELWRMVNVPLDVLPAFDRALDVGHVDLPLEAVGDSEDFVWRFGHTAVPEDPEYSPPPLDDDYDGWYADSPGDLPPLRYTAADREREEFHVPVLFRILPGARAVQGREGFRYEGRQDMPWQEFVTGGQFEVVSDYAEAHAGAGSRRIVTLRQTHVYDGEGHLIPAPATTPLEEFRRLGLTDATLGGGYSGGRLIDFIEERSLSDPRLVQRVDAAVKGARWWPYVRTPFARSLEGALDQDLDSVDPWAHEEARRALFERYPVRPVPLGEVTFTQPVVNRENVLAKVARGGDKRRPAFAVLDEDGVYWLVDGHHGVVADALLGRDVINMHVITVEELRAERQARRAERELVSAKAASPAVEWTRGDVYAFGLEVYRGLVEDGVEVKRRVRTAAGAAQFDLPIGAVIVEDAVPKVDRRRTQGQTRSNFVHPVTGHTMGKTEVGDTFEQLFKAKMTKGMNSKFGCCLKLITGAGEGTNRTTPLDFSVGKRGGEVKTLSSLAKNQKTAIKKEEVGRKLQACEAKGLDPLLCVQVVDLTRGRVRVYTFEAFESRAVSKMELVGEYRFSPADFEKAQRAAGHWDKAAERAAKQSTKQAHVGDEYDPPDEDGGTLEAGDTVIELLDDGTPVVYTLAPAEATETKVRRVRTVEGARLFRQPIGSVIVEDLLPPMADLSPPPPPQPGAQVYKHPQGGTIYVNQDGSMEAYNKYGKKKPTSATPEKLAYGHGSWYLADEVPTAPKPPPKLHAAEPPPKLAPPGKIYASQLQQGDAFIDEVLGVVFVENVTHGPLEAHVTDIDGHEFWLENDRLLDVPEDEESEETFEGIGIDDVEPPPPPPPPPPPKKPEGPKTTGGAVEYGKPPPGALVYRHPGGAVIYVLPDGTMYAFNKSGGHKETSATPAKLAAGHGAWTLETDDAAAKVVDDHAAGAAAGGEVEKPSTAPPATFKHEKPMKFEPGDLKDLEKYVADPNIVFQQKLDGIRGQLVVSPGQKPWFRSASGGKLVSDTAAKTTNPLLAKLPPAGEGTGYAIDGEILNGKLYVFDMVVEGHEKLPYEDRLAMAEAWTRHLQAAGITQVEPVPTARTPDEKRRLHKALLEGGGEGVMAKRRDAPYAPDKRVTHSVKLKFTSTADVVVTAKDTGGHKNYEIAMVGPDGKLIPMGSTSAQGKENAEVGDVIEVRYLSYAGPGASLVQPTMLRRRPEKLPEEATLDQLRVTNKEVVDASVMAEKSRRVRTPEGVRVFGQPIGTVIVPDVTHPKAFDLDPRVELDAREAALEDLDAAPELGPGVVDGKKVHSTIESSAELHPDVEDEDDQSVRKRLSAAFRRGRSKRASVWTDELYATQGRLSRGAVRRTLEGFYPGDKTYRKGYRLQVVKQGGKLYVTDGHHRLEAAVLLGEEELDADVVDLDKANVQVALQLAKKAGPDVARKLHDDAAAAEPAVSEVVQAAADVAGGRLELFDKRLKGEDAIVERIGRNMASAAARGLEPDAAKAGLGVPDVLRYTAVFEDGNYANGSIKLMKMLNALGFKAHYGGWGNSWAPGGTYKGLNLRLVAPDSGQQFELQFHTAESLAAKRANHKTYVEWRNLAPTDPRKKELGKEMADRAAAVAAPQGALGLNWRGAVWKDDLGWDGT